MTAVGDTVHVVIAGRVVVWANGVATIRTPTGDVTLERAEGQWFMADDGVTG